MSLLFKRRKLSTGYNRIVCPGASPLRLIEFGRILLDAASPVYTIESEQSEVALDVLYGAFDVKITGPTFAEATYLLVGKRGDAFTQKPAFVYIPRGSKCLITARSQYVDLAVCKAPARRDTKPVLSVPKEWVPVGVANWRRTYCIGLGDDTDADRLLVGETLIKPGCWSSYPPHKHDVYNYPIEEPGEEVYFYMIKPSTGFGLQRIYTTDTDPHPLDEVLVIRDGDTAIIPRGYHPLVAAAGYEILHVWMIAGDTRRFGAWSDDADHAWVRGCEKVIKDMTGDR